MLDTFFTQIKVRSRMESGPIGPYLSEIAAVLHRDACRPSRKRDLNPTTRCWHSWLRSNKNKMRSESPSNQLPEHIHSTHSAFYRTRHLERNAELGISLHIFEQNLLTTAVIKFRG